MYRKCRFCDKVFNILNALTRHVYTCRIRFQTIRRKIFHRETKQHENVYANIYNIVKLLNENDFLWKEKLSSVKINFIDENIYQFEFVTDTNLKLKIIALINEENYNETETQISQRQEIQFSTEKKRTMIYKNKIDKRANEPVEFDIKQLKIDHD